MTEKMDTHLTLSEKIYNLIVESILKKEVKPGERLTELELAKKYGISRTPIREAFRKLQTEGFIKVIPRKGAVVAEITEERIVEFYEVKGILEAYAGKLALKYITDKDIQDLERINNELEKIALSNSKEEIKKFIDIHNQFHERFVEISRNKVLIETLKNLVQKYSKFRIMVAYSTMLIDIVNEHKEIIEAFIKKDEKLVEEKIIKNSNFGINILKRYYLHK